MANDPHALVRELLQHIGENPDRDGLVDTPARVVRSWRELFGGYAVDPAQHLERQFPSTSSQMVHVHGITFSSTCEHHMLPFFGSVDVAYIPTGSVVGLSKFARVVDGYARRLQIQERLTNEVADAIMRAVPSCLGCAVRVRAQHSCMIARGARSPSASMMTTALRGAFLDDVAVRAEWQASLPSS